MPYYITDKSPECPEWAVVKEDGELIACHDSKQSAIDQAVAISIAEDEPFEGERAAVDSLVVGDYVSWDVLDPEVLGQVEMVQKQLAVVRIFEEDDGIFTATDKLMIINVFKIEKVRRPDMLAEEIEEMEEMEETPISDIEDRAINQAPPAYMRAAARRGLEYYEQGLAGDGVTPGTIREARAMVSGEVSDDKWIRIAAWIARHLVDLDSPDADPSSDNYPSAGVVAHLLWGSGPTKRAAERTQAYAESVVERIRQEETNSMDNKWIAVARAIQQKIDGTRSTKEPEIRTNTVEVRAIDSNGMTFEGYASMFNSPSEDLGGFIEYVAPGAFKRSLQSRNEIKLLWNHDTGEPLASLRGGSLKLQEDAVGLKVSAQLPNTTRGRDVAELLRSGVVDSMSFGFQVIKDSWSRDGKTRTLESVRLSEISIVSFPAYQATTATVRNMKPTIDADELATALLKLESGEELDSVHADLITEVVNKLRLQPEVQEVEDNGLSILDLKKKQFDLLMKRI